MIQPETTGAAISLQFQYKWQNFGKVRWGAAGLRNQTLTTFEDLEVSGERLRGIGQIGTE